MTSKAEKFRQECKHAEEKAAITTGPFRDLLLSIADAYALLARLEDELFPLTCRPPN
jgi:hypothetical protein